MLKSMQLAALAIKWAQEALEHEDAADESEASAPDEGYDEEAAMHRLQAETLRGCVEDLLDAFVGSNGAGACGARPRSSSPA